MSHLRSAVLLLLGIVSFATPPLAQAGDIAAGRTIMERCQVWHGNDGLGRQPYIPNLAGQKAVYLVHSLMTYKAGERKSPNMADAVKGLSVQDMANVAAMPRLRSPSKFRSDGNETDHVTVAPRKLLSRHSYSSPPAWARWAHGMAEEAESSFSLIEKFPPAFQL